MVDLEELEMTDLGESDGFGFESHNGEGGEYEAAFDYEGGDFEVFEDFEQFESLDASYEDLEADPVIDDLMNKASRTLVKVAQDGLSPKFFQQLAGQAARVAGGAVGGKTCADIASQIANQVLREGDSESWYESDASYEYGPIEPEVLDEMHYNAYQAAESPSEYEADPFIANLVGPLVSGLLSGESDPSYEELYEDGEFAYDSGESDPSYEELYEDGEFAYDHERDEFLPALLPMAMPLISKGVGAIGKMLSKNNTTRKLTRCLPQILNESANEVQDLGRPPTQRDVAGILGRQSARAFGSPRAVARNFRQNRIAASRAQARPAGAGWNGASRPGSMMRRPMGPSYGRAYGPGPVRGRRRDPVVCYMLTPIYDSSPS